MRAAIFYDEHDIRVEDVEEPGPLKRGQVRLRPILCGICGTDLHEYLAGPIVIPTSPHPLTGSSAPQVLGHELSARVLEVADDVSTVAVGHRVSVQPLVFCGECYYCRRGLNHLCVQMACVGLSFDGGGIAEQLVLSASQVSVLPDTVSDKQGALIEPSAVAAYGVDRTGLRAGDSILITGAGPIGALSALYAHVAGASQVIISEPNPKRRALAASFGIATILDPTSDDVTSAVKDMTGGVGVDVAAECSGSEPGLNAALNAVRSHGTITQVGLHIKPASFDPMNLSNRDLTLIGTWCYPVTDWPRIIALVASGRFPVEKAVSDVVPVADIVERGFDRLLDPSGDAQKILVEVV